VPAVWILAADRPAVVLGSTQPDTAVDRERARAGGFEVVRRRSGGGAVVLRPGAVVWVDVLVPATDGLWTVDVGRAFSWLGETWVEALAAVGVPDARWHNGPMLRTPLSDSVCFAGLGPGEVTVGGRKVVGMSQRRTRHAALFQCAALLEWDAGAVAELLGLDGTTAAELEQVARGLAVDAEALEGAFVEALARR
jgi:lipoate---protein ligase